ncbi:hypothetical protein WR25_16621 [Diploscapter pachys]|uniref:glutaminase n=1 Tax=Diploscapter pachys TaxID=2018661 RepID=A0A2A2L606_9BILA|nr:hypothetical protein WR25_16621 [Diploscapter pachys]
MPGSPICRSMSHDSKYRSHMQELIFDLYKDEATGRLFLPKFFKELVEAGIRKDDPRLEQMIRQVKETEHLEEEILVDTHNLQLDRDAFKSLLDVALTPSDSLNMSFDSAARNLPPAARLTSSLDSNASSLANDIALSRALYISRDMFCGCVGNSIGVISKALKNQLVIPDWPGFTNVIGEIFEEIKPNLSGNVATYIPQLARANPNAWAVSVCTVDGQRKSWGDAFKPFCLQSVSKPFTYALVHDEIGADELHSHIGQEPSGRLFNDISLDHNKKPHNPLINAGAIVAASLMKRHASLSDRFDFAIRQFRRFCGTGYVGFNNAVFLSERETADRNYALSYYMREHKCFPESTNLQDTLDLYFQLCSIETNCDTLSVMAATLANGGVNPLNGERIINNRACRDTLSLMYSCGMYDWSGQFAFRIGLPAKSGVAGDLIIVIPNVAGIAIYSPRLDTLGNTVRGVKFAEALIQRFNFHNYDSLLYSDCQKLDPRKSLHETESESTSKYLFAAKLGDISAIKRYLLMGLNIHDRDYDDRTALHVAASEGDVACLEYLLSKWRESPEPQDRFGRTPLDDAKFFKHEESIQMLQKAIDAWRISEGD